METWTFEGTCRHCTEAGRTEVEARVTGNGASKPWRHDYRPAKPHHAWPTGTLRQL